MPVDGPSEFVPVGYVMCQCGEWLADGSRQADNGYCDPCMKAHDAELYEALVRFEVQGQVFESTPNPRPPKDQRKGRPRAKETAKIKATQLAKRRALRRLARIYAPQYELLLAAERAAAGLDPRVRMEPPVAMVTRQALLADIAEAEEREVRAGQARLLHSA